SREPGHRLRAGCLGRSESLEVPVGPGDGLQSRTRASDLSLHFLPDRLSVAGQSKQGGDRNLTECQRLCLVSLHFPRVALLLSFEVAPLKQLEVHLPERGHPVVEEGGCGEVGMAIGEDVPYSV